MSSKTQGFLMPQKLICVNLSETREKKISGQAVLAEVCGVFDPPVEAPCRKIPKQKGLS